MSGAGHQPYHLPANITPSHGPAWLPGQMPPGGHGGRHPPHHQSHGSNHFGSHPMSGMMSLPPGAHPLSLSPHPPAMALSSSSPGLPGSSPNPGESFLSLGGHGSDAASHTIGSSPLVGSLTTGAEASGIPLHALDARRRSSLTPFAHSIPDDGGTVPRSSSPTLALASANAAGSSRPDSSAGLAGNGRTGNASPPKVDSGYPSRAPPPGSLGSPTTINVLRSQSCRFARRECDEQWSFGGWSRTWQAWYCTQRLSLWRA